MPLCTDCTCSQLRQMTVVRHTGISVNIVTYGMIRHIILCMLLAYL